MSETNLARNLRAWLLEGGWEVYQEVQVHSGGAILDLACTRGESLLWAIECKLGAGLDVLGQAEKWLGYANLVSVCVPEGRSSRGRHMFVRCAELLGMGVLEVGVGWVRHSPGKLWRTRGSEALRKTLQPEHRAYAEAGTNRGGHYTPWKATADEIERIVRTEPGITIPQLLDRLEKHHYASDSSARAAIYGDLRRGWIRGIECKLEAREGSGRKVLRLYSKHAAGGSVCPRCSYKLVLGRCPSGCVIGETLAKVGGERAPARE